MLYLFGHISLNFEQDQPMIKNVLYVLSGVIIGGAVIYLVESIGHKIYPLPENLDWTDTEALGNHISTLPAGAFIIVLLAYILGSLAGGFMTIQYKNSGMPNAIAVGFILLLLGLLNFLMIQHPTWFIVISLLLYVPFAYLGGRLGLKIAKYKFVKTG
jgi:hypothetical protein